MNISQACIGIKEALVCRLAGLVNGGISTSTCLDPYCGIARIARDARHIERLHPKPGSRQAVEVGLMSGGGYVVVDFHGGEWTVVAFLSQGTANSTSLEFDGIRCWRARTGENDTSVLCESDSQEYGEHACRDGEKGWDMHIEMLMSNFSLEEERYIRLKMENWSFSEDGGADSVWKVER